VLGRRMKGNGVRYSFNLNQRFKPGQILETILMFTWNVRVSVLAILGASRHARIQGQCHCS